MSKKVQIIDIKDGKKVQSFDTWNAASFYFHDASGNIAEFIVRYDLKNEIAGNFDISQIICINEIGMPTKNIQKLNDQLIADLRTDFWKGDLTRFGTNGSQEGIFLLPNYDLKNLWFPTEIKIKPEPFEAIIENHNQDYIIEFKNEILKTSIIS